MFIGICNRSQVSVYRNIGPLVIIYINIAIQPNKIGICQSEKVKVSNAQELNCYQKHSPNLNTKWGKPNSDYQELRY